MNENISRSYFDLRKTKTKNNETFDEKVSNSSSDLRKNPSDAQETFGLEGLDISAAETRVILSGKPNLVQSLENDNKLGTPVNIAENEKEKDVEGSLRRNKKKGRNEKLANSNSNIGGQKNTTAENKPDANRGTLSSTSNVKSIMKNPYGSEYEELVSIDPSSFFSKPGKINKVVSFLLPDIEENTNKVDNSKQTNNVMKKSNTKNSRKHYKKR